MIPLGEALAVYLKGFVVASLFMAALIFGAWLIWLGTA